MDFFSGKYFFAGIALFLFFSSCPAQPTSEDIQEVERLHRLGVEVSMQRGGWLSALSYFGDALRLSRKISYKQGEADVLRSIADLESKAPYRNDEALEYLLMELRVREELGDPHGIANTYLYIGEFFQKRFHLHEEAIAYFRQAITILNTVEQPESEVYIQSWKKIADAYAFVEDMPGYFAANDSLLNFYKKIGALEEASTLSMEISKQQAELENLDKSLKYAEKGKRYYSLTAVENTREAQKNLKEFDTYLNSLKTEKETKETRRKNRRSLYLFLLLIPFLAGSWVIWRYLYRKSLVK